MSEFIIERAGFAALKPYSFVPPSSDVFLDANENPYAMPQVVREKVLERLGDLAFNRYPQIDACALRSALAVGLNVDLAKVQVGNGSSELLTACCHAFGGAGRKIAYPYPSFSMYEVYVRLSDSTPCPYQLTEDFSLDVAGLKDFFAREKPSVLIICNPNNPTGNLARVEQLKEVLAVADCLVLVDEAYMEFADQSLLPSLAEYKNLVVLRTFSKAYGLASSRVGYMVSDNEGIIKTVGKVLLPYHVNALSLAVAQVVYEQRAVYEKIIKELIGQRGSLAESLKDMGLKVYPSAANFVFFSVAGSPEQGQRLSGFLAGEKISVRDFSSHPALAGGIRLTVGTAEENAKVLISIEKFLRAGGKS